MSNLVRVPTRAYEDIDLYTAVMQDVEWMFRNNGRRVPPNISRVLNVQKRLNDNLRYVMVEFIQKNFAITLPDGAPINVSPTTAQNIALVQLSEGYANVAGNDVALDFTSDVFIGGSVDVNVSAVTNGTGVPTNISVEEQTVSIPGFEIPQVQEITVSNGNASIGVVHPAVTIFPQQFAVPKITFDRADIGSAVLTLTVLEDGNPVFEDSHKAGIGRETFSFLYALKERESGSHNYRLQARLTGGTGSIQTGGGRLQVWAQARTRTEGN